MPTPDPDYVALRNAALSALNGSPAQLEAIEAAHQVYLQLDRGGRTPAGMPYPSPLDPLFEVADAIRALADALGDSGVIPTAAGGIAQGTVFSSVQYQFTFPRPFAFAPRIFLQAWNTTTATHWATLEGPVTGSGFLYRINRLGAAPIAGFLNWWALPPLGSPFIAEPRTADPDMSPDMSDAADAEE